MTNDLKYQEYLKRTFLRYSTIFLSILTIVLEILALFGFMSFIWGLIPFILSNVAKYFYTKKNEKVDKKK